MLFRSTNRPAARIEHHHHVENDHRRDHSDRQPDQQIDQTKSSGVRATAMSHRLVDQVRDHYQMVLLRIRGRLPVQCQRDGARVVDH